MMNKSLIISNNTYIQSILFQLRYLIVYVPTFYPVNKYGEKMRELVNRDEVASQVSAHNVAPLSKIFVQERNFRVFKVANREILYERV